MGNEKNYTPRKLHNYNQKYLFNEIRTRETISRAQLSKLTGISATSVTRIINDFIAAGLVNEGSTIEDGNVGRRATQLTIEKNSMYAMGISVDVQDIAGGILNLKGELIHRKVIPNRGAIFPGAVLERICSLYQSIWDELGDSNQIRQRLAGLGICLPGIVTWPDGIAEFSPQLSWSHIPVRQLLQDRLETEVLVENNVKASALAETMFGSAWDRERFVMIEIGSGLGGAFVINGKVLRGDGVLGEIGHILVVKDGELCDCGRRGCLQAYTCIGSLEKRAGIPIEKLIEGAQEGGARMQALMDEAVHHMSTMLANVINIYNPEVIILYGKMLDCWPGLFERLKETSAEYRWDPVRNLPEIRKSDYNNEDLRIIAAASTVFNDALLPEIIPYESVLKSGQNLT